MESNELLSPPRKAAKASSFIEEESPTLPPRCAVVADLVPDLHGLIPGKGLTTELESHDTKLTKETITAAEQKSIPPTVTIPGAFHNAPKHLIPEWYRTGWTSLAAGKNPGGALNIKATQSDFLDEVLPWFLYGEWYHNGAALFFTAIVSWTLAKMNAGIGSILLLCLCIGMFTHTLIVFLD